MGVVVSMGQGDIRQFNAGVLQDAGGDFAVIIEYFFNGFSFLLFGDKIFLTYYSLFIILRRMPYGTAEAGIRYTSNPVIGFELALFSLGTQSH